MYTIKDIAEKFSVSEHTLRFYSDKGLFPTMKRDENGARIFGEKDMGWIKIVLCMRSIGTPLKDIKHYVDLCLEGDSTIEERFKIILRRREEAEAQLEELKGQIELLEYKVGYYKELVESHSPDKWNPLNENKAVSDGGEKTRAKR